MHNKKISTYTLNWYLYFKSNTHTILNASWKKNSIMEKESKNEKLRILQRKSSCSEKKTLLLLETTYQHKTVHCLIFITHVLNLLSFFRCYFFFLITNFQHFFGYPHLQLLTLLSSHVELCNFVNSISYYELPSL